jgi:hypothetical protein
MPFGTTPGFVEFSASGDRPARRIPFRPGGTRCALTRSNREERQCRRTADAPPSIQWNPVRETAATRPCVLYALPRRETH